MKRKWAIAVLVSVLVSLTSTFGASAQEAPRYRNRELPVEQRVADLLGRMTLEEKVAQLESAWANKSFFTNPQDLFVDEKGQFVPERAKTLLQHGIGEITHPSDNRGPRAMVEFTNTVQRWMIENTRLGTSREAWSPNHPGDRDSLDLLANQTTLPKRCWRRASR